MGENLSMIGIIIATIIKDKRNLELLIKSIGKCQNEYRCLIINQNNNIQLDINERNVKLLNVNFKNNSEAKNLGIDYFQDKSYVKFIWFLDDDCFVYNKDLKKLYKKIINSQNKLHNIFILQIINYNNINVGVKIHNLGIFNFFYLFRIGGPSLIIKKNIITSKFNKLLGPGTKFRSSEDIDFHLANFNFRVKYLKNILIYHPTEIINENKIVRYSYGQGYMFQKLNLIKKVFFLILSFSRPIIGFICFYFFNTIKKRMYKRRIVAFIRGFMKY